MKAPVVDAARAGSPIASREQFMLLEEVGHSLDLVAGIERQPGADRAAGIERTLSDQDLCRNQIPQHRNVLVFFLVLDDPRLDGKRNVGRRDRPVRICRVPLDHSKEFAEFQNLIDLKDVLLENADNRSVDPGQFRQPRDIDVRRRKSAQLALEFQIIGDLLFLGELIDEVNGGWKLALKLIAGLNADDILPGLAPLAVQILDGVRPRRRTRSADA